MPEHTCAELMHLAQAACDSGVGKTLQPLITPDNAWAVEPTAEISSDGPVVRTCRDSAQCKFELHGMFSLRTVSSALWVVTAHLYSFAFELNAWWPFALPRTLQLGHGSTRVWEEVKHYV